MLTIGQIQKKFKLDTEDAHMLGEIQAMGLDYGARGVSIKSEEFSDDAAFDIEHTAVLLDIEERDILKLFTDAMAEGVRLPLPLLLDPIHGTATTVERGPQIG